MVDGKQFVLEALIGAEEELPGLPVGDEEERDRDAVEEDGVAVGGKVWPHSVSDGEDKSSNHCESCHDPATAQRKSMRGQRGGPRGDGEEDGEAKLDRLGGSHGSVVPFCPIGLR